MAQVHRLGADGGRDDISGGLFDRGSRESFWIPSRIDSAHNSDHLSRIRHQLCGKHGDGVGDDVG